MTRYLFAFGLWVAAMAALDATGNDVNLVGVAIIAALTATLPITDDYADRRSA